MPAKEETLLVGLDRLDCTKGIEERLVAYGELLGSGGCRRTRRRSCGSAQQSLIVGSPDTCRKKLQAYADLGIDRLMCLQQIGPIGADEVMTSIRLIGELIPEFDRS